MLGEDDELILRWRGHHLVPWSSSLDIGGEKASKPMGFELLCRNCGSPQSAEIDHFDEEDLAAAAAAMSIVRLDVEALALEAALERLGAMASVRIELCAGKK